MNRTLKSILAAALALVLALLPLRSGVHAVMEDALIGTNDYLYYEDIINNYDREKLLAFWNIANEEGLTNGEAVFISEYPDAWLDEIGGHEYEGTALTPLILFHGIPTAEDYKFYFNLSYELNELVPLPDGAPGEGYATVYPELYGELDLSGTSIYALQSDINPHKQHISSVNLDGCEKLEQIYLCGLDELGELSALDCSMLRSIVADGNGLHRIAVSPVNYEAPVLANSFGTGSMGLIYRAGDSSETTLYAYPKADAFVGWFEGGELVSTELEYVRTEGGSLVAVFGGDADGDGAVTVADAVLTMRASMGIIQVANSGMLDVDGSEDIDVSDALLIMRFAMGLIG